jgi:hypothetical protein
MKYHSTRQISLYFGLFGCISSVEGGGNLLLQSPAPTRRMEKTLLSMAGPHRYLTNLPFFKIHKRYMHPAILRNAKTQMLIFFVSLLSLLIMISTPLPSPYHQERKSGDRP